MRKTDIYTGLSLGKKQIDYICNGINLSNIVINSVLIDDNTFYLRCSDSDMFVLDTIDDVKDFVHLNYYIKNRNPDKVLEIVKRNKNLDYNFCDGLLVDWATINGHIEVFKEIIKMPEVDISYSISNSSEFGHSDIVELLLKDSTRVYPIDELNYAIRKSAYFGQTEVVKLLLKDKRADPSANYNYAIKWASSNGHTEVVRLLLQDPRVDPSANYNYAIKWASSNGHTEVVKLLLQDTRVDPNNHSIGFASENGHVEVVKLLIQDKRVDPSDDNNYAIRWAIKNGHAEVVKLLLQDTKVRACLTKKQIEEY